MKNNFYICLRCVLQLRFCGTKCFPIIGTLFMTISLTASLGNILRLPTTVFLHGGGKYTKNENNHEELSVSKIKSKDVGQNN